MNPTAATAAPASFHPASSPDYVPREPLESLQSERLVQVVGRAFEHVAIFRQRMQKHGLAPAEVRGLDDLEKLPFMTKSDLADAYPLGALAVPVHKVARLHPIGVTTDRPLVAAYTRRDIKAWTELAVRSLASCGLDQGDVILNACGQELFADGLGLHYGAEALGATVVAAAAGDTARRIAVLKDLGVSAILATPSYFLHLVERAEKLGVDLRDLPLRVGVVIGEPWSEALRERIEEATGILTYDVYGRLELLGPGVGAECCCRNGVHVFEDHFLPEIVDPQSGKPLPDGEEGELVLTTLSKEAMPMIRYRTRERTAILAEPCPCGRTMRRIRRIAGGAPSASSGEVPDVNVGEEAFNVQGVSVLASQIEAALLAVEGTLPRYQVVLSEENGLDRVEVQIEVTPDTLSDRVSVMENLQTRIAQEIQDTLAVTAAVRLVEPHTIGRVLSGIRQVIDKRGERGKA